MAMEPPTELAPGAISEEKNKVFRSLRPIEPDQSCGASTRATATKPVRRRLRDRDVRRPALRHRQLALGRRPFFRAPASAWPRARASSPSCSGSRPRACSPSAPAWAAGTRPPHVRPGRCRHAVVLVLRQAPGAGHEARQAEPPVRGCTRPAAVRARGRPAAHPRRHEWRPHALHDLGRHRAAVGDLDAAARHTAAGSLVPAGVCGARTRSTS